MAPWRREPPGRPASWPHDRDKCVSWGRLPIQMILKKQSSREGFRKFKLYHLPGLFVRDQKIILFLVKVEQRFRKLDVLQAIRLELFDLSVAIERDRLRSVAFFFNAEIRLGKPA